jgi:hypothetical protein
LNPSFRKKGKILKYKKKGILKKIEETIPLFLKNKKLYTFFKKPVEI